MDSEDIENLYVKYGPMVLRRCRFLLKSEDLALDAMQEVFVRLLSRKDHLTAEYPSALLYKIATNICLNYLKAGKRNVSLETTDPEAVIHKIADHDDFVDRIHSRDLIEKIFRFEPVSTREMAVMHYVDGLTLQETAKECGLSISGVRKRLGKLRKKIQDQKTGVNYE